VPEYIVTRYSSREVPKIQEELAELGSQQGWCLVSVVGVGSDLIAFLVRDEDGEE